MLPSNDVLTSYVAPLSNQARPYLSLVACQLFLLLDAKSRRQDELLASITRRPKSNLLIKPLRSVSKKKKEAPVSSEKPIPIIFLPINDSAKNETNRFLFPQNPTKNASETFKISLSVRF